MAKLSGRSGRIKLGTLITITAATSAAGKVSVTADNTLSAGMFVLISGVVGMVDLNNSGKGHLVTDADATTFEVALTTSQTYTSGGTAQRIIPITAWKLKKTSGLAEVPDSESGEWMDRIVAGLKDWDGSFDGIESDGALDPPIQEEHAIELDINATQYYSGNAIFETFDTGVEIKGTNGVAISGTFKGNGLLTKTITPIA